MPHIAIKMLKGRTEEQKRKAADAVAGALSSALNCGKGHITVTVEDYTALQWQEVFKREIADKPESAVFIKPTYDPKDLL